MNPHRVSSTWGRSVSCRHTHCTRARPGARHTLDTWQQEEEKQHSQHEAQLVLTGHAAPSSLVQHAEGNGHTHTHTQSQRAQSHIAPPHLNVDGSGVSLRPLPLGRPDRQIHRRLNALFDFTHACVNVSQSGRVPGEEGRGGQGGRRDSPRIHDATM